MKTSIRMSAIVMVALGSMALGACAPPGGGATLQTGCFETFWGPDQGRFQIARNSLGTYYLHVYSPGHPTCAGSPTGSATQIFPGRPNANSDIICQSQHGPDATASEMLSQAIVPRQYFWSCNYPL